MEDLERSEKLILKLFIPLYFDIITIIPDFLTQNVATSLYALIVGFLLQLLYLK